jgi:hypothetical protein
MKEGLKALEHMVLEWNANGVTTKIVADEQGRRVLMIETTPLMQAIQGMVIKDNVIHPIISHRMRDMGINFRDAVFELFVKLHVGEELRYVFPWDATNSHIETAATMFVEAIVNFLENLGYIVGTEDS